MIDNLPDPGSDSTGPAPKSDLPEGYMDHLRTRHHDVASSVDVPSAVETLTNAERRAASTGQQHGHGSDTNNRHATQRRFLLVAAALVLVLAGSIGFMATRNNQKQTHSAGPPKGEQNGGSVDQTWNGMPMLFPDDPSRSDDEYFAMSMIGADDIYGTPSLSEPLWGEAYAAGEVGEQLRFISIQSFASSDAEQVFDDLMTLPGPVLNLLSTSQDTSLNQTEAELKAGFDNLWGPTGEPDAARSSVKVNEISLPAALTTALTAGWKGSSDSSLRAFEVHVTELYGRTLNQRLIFIQPRPIEADPSLPTTVLSMRGVDDTTMIDVVKGLQVVDGRIHLGAPPAGFTPMFDGARWQPNGDFPGYSAWRSSGGGETESTFSGYTSMVSVLDAGTGSASYLTSTIGTLSGQDTTVIRTGPDWVFAVDTVYMVGIADGIVTVLNNPLDLDELRTSGGTTAQMAQAWDRITKVDRATFDAAIKRGEKLMASMQSPECATEEVTCGPIEPAVTTTVVGDTAGPGD